MFTYLGEGIQLYKIFKRLVAYIYPQNTCCWKLRGNIFLEINVLRRKLQEFGLHLTYIHLHIYINVQFVHLTAWWP